MTSVSPRHARPETHLLVTAQPPTWVCMSPERRLSVSHMETASDEADELASEGLPARDHDQNQTIPSNLVRSQV